MYFIINNKIKTYFYAFMKIMSINEYMNTSNIMYRNDNYSISKTIDIKDIICFETGELHNCR